MITIQKGQQLTTKHIISDMFDWINKKEQENPDDIIRITMFICFIVGMHEMDKFYGGKITIEQLAEKVDNQMNLIFNPK